MALNDLFAAADLAIQQGVSLIILSDKGINENQAAIPALLAVSGLHHHFIRQGTRTAVSIIVETGEAHDVHQQALLIGYGADAINPYLALASIRTMVEKGELDENISYEKAIQHYLKAVTEGIVKVMSKMGISTIQSYRGAQIFEAVGIGADVIERYFSGTASQLSGIDLVTIADEALIRHRKAAADSLE